MLRSSVTPKRHHLDLTANIQFWKCGVCEVSSAGYVKHLKGHQKYVKQYNYANLPHLPDKNPCVVFRSSFGLRRHRVAIYADSVNPVKDTEYICHMYMRPMKSNADLKCQIRDHGLRNETEAFTSDAKGEEGALI